MIFYLLLLNIYASDQPVTENTLFANYADDKALISIDENPLIALIFYNKLLILFLSQKK
jgi:hypothetical protein